MAKPQLIDASAATASDELRVNHRRNMPTPIRGALVAVALLSGVVNILYLTGSVFMLQVYDRVLASRSVPTLIALAAIALMLYAYHGLFEALRSRILIRVAAATDRALGVQTLEAILHFPLRFSSQGRTMQPLRDLDQIRSFLSGLGPVALFDLPWIPLYIGVCFAFHFWMGMVALLGAVLLSALTIATEFLTRAPSRAAADAGARRNALAEAGKRNAEVVRAMGMGPQIRDSWMTASEDYLRHQTRIADVSGGFGAATKVLRLAVQSAVLGVGAYLVIAGDATGGIMIAGSILAARALAPVELAVANWRHLVAARQSWRRLHDYISRTREQEIVVKLPAPRESLAVERLTVGPPGISQPTVMDVNFSLERGQALGVIGASGSGKSTLVRALVGAWTPLKGKVRLDGAALDQWSPDDLGKSIGYLPQDVELFAGTVGENIARFALTGSSDAIVAAARAAGVHQLICSLPAGYETPVGEGGVALSAGQRQRIALARALYNDPFLVVLDEPNSNLDANGEACLTQAISGVRARGGIVIVVAHRSSALAAVDHLLMMADGRLRAFGAKNVPARRLEQPDNSTSVAVGVRRSEADAGVDESTHTRHLRGPREVTA